MEITIDGGTKIVLSTAVVIRRHKGGEPVDLSRDSVLIIDPRTNRPVAMIRPIRPHSAAPSPPRAPESAPPPEPTPKGSNGAAPPGGSSASPPPAPGGRLTDAERERLERIWVENPGWSAQKVANDFALRSGRRVPTITAESYRPKPPGKPEPSVAPDVEFEDKLRAGKKA